MSGLLIERPSAYRLQGPVPALLNHLCQLGQGRLILRQEGLSLAKTTSFGLCVADGREGWNLLRDAISGLESDLRFTRQVYLLPDPDDEVPVFATASPGGGIDLSVRFEGLSWRSRNIRSLIESCHAVPVDGEEGRKLGAGAWLDDWKTTSPASEGIRCEILAALDGCRCLEVGLCSGMHRCLAAFCPAFLDSEGAVIRVADAKREHVVFADTGAAGFRWSSLAPGHVRILAS